MAELLDYRFKTEPFKHQLEAWTRSRDLEYFALLMEMGTGKSKVLVDTLAWLFGRGQVNAALIVAPKSVVGTWAEEQLPLHLPDSVHDPLIVTWDPGPNKAKREEYNLLFTPDALRLKVLIMNIDAFSTKKGCQFAEAFLNAHHALWALDESTRIKSPSTKRTRAVLKLARLARYRRILTGMPVTQSPLDVYCQYEFMKPGLLDQTNWFAFRYRYAILVRRVFNGRSVDLVTGYQRLDELQRLILRHGYRKLKGECLDLPPKVYQTRTVELTDEQRKLYDKLKKDAVVELSKEQRVTAPLVMVKLLRLRQLLAGTFVTDAGEHVDVGCQNRLDELMAAVEETQGKVIIWCTFVDSIHRIWGELAKVYGDKSACMFYGGTGPELRQNLVDWFQNPADELRFFVGQVHTGGLGLTLTAADTVIYYEHDWSFEARAQSEDRAHRIGQTRSVTYVDLVARDTVDETMVQAVKAKKGLADQVTGDGWRDLFR